MRTVIFILACLLATATAFVPSHNRIQRSPQAASLKMGLFDGLFGPKEAEAYHILLKGPNANKQCEKLKLDIYKKAIGPNGPQGGVDAEDLINAFSQQARAKSTCPSKQNGGNLGVFGRGQMVPEFDAVAFEEQVGVIHGPVETQFGSHLILVTDRK